MRSGWQWSKLYEKICLSFQMTNGITKSYMGRPGAVAQNLHFNKIPRWFIYSLNSEKHRTIKSMTFRNSINSQRPVSKITTIIQFETVSEQYCGIVIYELGAFPALETIPKFFWTHIRKGEGFKNWKLRDIPQSLQGCFPLLWEKKLHI